MGRAPPIRKTRPTRWWSGLPQKTQIPKGERVLGAVAAADGADEAVQNAGDSVDDVGEELCDDVDHDGYLSVSVLWSRTFVLLTGMNLRRIILGCNIEYLQFPHWYPRGYYLRT